MLVLIVAQLLLRGGLVKRAIVVVVRIVGLRVGCAVVGTKVVSALACCAGPTTLLVSLVAVVVVAAAVGAARVIPVLFVLF